MTFRETKYEKWGQVATGAANATHSTRDFHGRSKL